MTGRRIASIVRRVKRAVTQPLHELNRWQRAVRYAYDLGKHGARQLREDRAPQIAAALAFRALFAFFPVLVVGTILVRSVIGIDEFLKVVDSLMISAVGEVQINLPADAMERSTTLSDWLDTLIGEAASVQLVAIGWVGLVVVVYAAIGLMVTIETAFNTIYRAPEGRSWTRRVPLYWFVLTVAPVAIGMAAFVNGRFEMWIESVETWQWTLTATRMLWALFFAWLFLFAAYTLIPNTNVHGKPAAIGAMVAVVLVACGLRFLGAYLHNAFSISQLYRSLGLIPLFMFWVYLMWLAVLFGLEVSGTLQVLRGRRLVEIEGKRPTGTLADPSSVVTVMEIAAEGFLEGRRTTIAQICEETALSESTVGRIVKRLESAELLHRIDGVAESVCLARTPDQIPVQRLVDIGFQLIDESGVGRRSQLTDRLREAQMTLAAPLTLASFVLSSPPADTQPLSEAEN